MSVSQDELNGVVAQIRHTPQLLQLMLMGSNSDDLAWKPEASRYSIGEVLAHLVHVDEHCNGLRLRRTLEEQHPLLHEYDDASFLSQPPEYLANGPARLDEFTASRARWMRLIEAVTLDQSERIGQHEKYGPITAGVLLHQ